MISPVTRGDADRDDERVGVADELDQPSVGFGIGRRRLDIIRRTIEFAVAKVGDPLEPLELRVADDRGADAGLAGKDDGGSSVGHSGVSFEGWDAVAGRVAQAKGDVDVGLGGVTSPPSNSSRVTARPR